MEKARRLDSRRGGPRHCPRRSHQRVRSSNKKYILVYLLNTECITDVLLSGVIAEKTSSELFSLDTAGDKVIQRQYHKQHKPLKADEILAQRSAVLPVDSHKRASSKITDGVLEPKQKRLRSGGVSQKELKRLKKFAHGGDAARAKDIEEQSPTAGTDLWKNDETAKEDAWRSSFPFLEPAKPIKEPATLKRDPISLAASGKEIPAVKKPKPEISYNPQSTEYFQAFIKKGEEEVQAELKRRKEAEEEAQRQVRVDRAREEAEAHERTIEGDESVWEGFESEIDDDNRTVAVSELQKKRPERKTRTQRNKIARRKEAEQKAIAEARMKQRAKEAAQIEKIVRSLDGRRKQSEKSAVITANERAEKSSDEEGETVLRRRGLGKAPYVLYSHANSTAHLSYPILTYRIKFLYLPQLLLISQLIKKNGIRLAQENLEFILPSELQESLRQLKPQGNLLRDRFRSAIMRGRMESRKPIQQPKARKVTVTEKWTYKDWKLPA